MSVFQKKTDIFYVRKQENKDGTTKNNLGRGEGGGSLRKGASGSRKRRGNQ